MGASSGSPLHDVHEIIPQSATELPPARFSVADIHFIPVSIPIANYVLSMIYKISRLLNPTSRKQKPSNPPSYWYVINNKLQHFHVIESNIIDNKYKNVGEILSDIDSVWKSMYELSADQSSQNIPHDPKSDFVTFAAGIESEFYSLWDEFELLLVNKHYLKESTQLSSAKWTSKYFIGKEKLRKQPLIHQNKVKNTTSCNKNAHTPKSPRDEEDDDDNNDNDNDDDDNDESDDLKKWLSNTVQLPQYYDIFVQNGFDDLSFVIGIIRMNDLKEMKIEKLGHRRKILALADSPDHKKRKYIEEIQDPDDHKSDNEDHKSNQEELSITDDYQEPQRKRRKLNEDYR